jgi:hypothetical protein
LSDQFNFRGVNPKSGSPYTDEELKARDAKRQRPADQLHLAVKGEVLQRTIGAMNHFDLEEQVEALTLSGWDLDALAPLVKQRKIKESEKQDKIAEQNQAKAEELRKIYDTPENNVAKYWKASNRAELRKMPSEQLFQAITTLERHKVSVPPLSVEDYAQLETYIRTILTERQILTQKDNPSLAQKIAQYLHLV